MGVQQGKAPLIQAVYQIHKGHLAGVGDAAEHAFAKKDRPNVQAIQAPHQLALLPDLDAVGMTQIMQITKQAIDFTIDPCFWPFFRGRRTALHHIRKGRIHPNVPWFFQDFFQAAGYMQRPQGHDASHIGIHPEQLFILCPLRHGKQTKTIGLKQDFWGEGGGHGAGCFT